MIKKLRSLSSRERAFTLVELLIVIAIIAILTLAFLPNILKAPAKARDAIRLKQVSDIANAVEVYATEKGNPPNETEGGADTCFMPTLAEKLGIIAPDDSKKLNSCNAAAGAATTGRFYYRFEEGASPVFYIVATKLEAASASNTVATWTAGGTTTAGVSCNPAGIGGVSTLECAKSLTSVATPAPNATEFWRVAAGPQ